MNEFKVANVHALSYATAIVGQIVAWVPSLATDQQVLISAGSFLLSLIILLSHAIRVNGKTVAVTADEVAAKIIPKIDFSATVKNELAHIFEQSKGNGPIQ